MYLCLWIASVSFVDSKLAFIIVPCIYIYQRSISSYSSELPRTFNFNLKDFFNVSCRVSLTVMKSFSFCLSQNVLILPTFLKDSFARYKIITDHFSFSASTVFWPPSFKFTDNLIKDNFNLMSHISLAAFKIFFVFRWMCLSVGLFEFILIGVC